MISTERMRLNDSYGSVVEDCRGVETGSKLGENIAYACVRAIHFLTRTGSPPLLPRDCAERVAERFDKLEVGEQEALLRAVTKAVVGAMGPHPITLRDECVLFAEAALEALQAQPKLAIRNLSPEERAFLRTWLSGVCAGVELSQEVAQIRNRAVRGRDRETDWPSMPRGFRQI